VYPLFGLEAIISVTRSYITSNFCPFSIYCGDKYVAPDMRDFFSTLDGCSLAACSICSQNSSNEERTDSGSSFASASIMVDTSKAWVMLTTPKMPFPMDGY